MLENPDAPTIPYDVYQQGRERGVADWLSGIFIDPYMPPKGSPWPLRKKYLSAAWAAGQDSCFRDAAIMFDKLMDKVI